MFRNRSLIGSCMSSVLVITVVGLCSLKCWSDTITFSESKRDLSPVYTYSKGKFTMKGLFFTSVGLTDLQSLLTTNTILDVSVGNWGEWSFLGDDPKYHNSGTKATIVLAAGNICSEKIAIQQHGSIKFSASSKGVGITISTKTGSTYCNEYENSPVGDLDAGENGAVTNILNVSITVSNDVTVLTTNINVTATGTAAIKSFNNQGTPYNLNSVKISGKQ